MPARKSVSKKHVSRKHFGCGGLAEHISFGARDAEGVKSVWKRAADVPAKYYNTDDAPISVLSKFFDFESTRKPLNVDTFGERGARYILGKKKVKSARSVEFDADQDKSIEKVVLPLSKFVDGNFSLGSRTNTGEPDVVLVLDNQGDIANEFPLDKSTVAIRNGQPIAIFINKNKLYALGDITKLIDKPIPKQEGRLLTKDDLEEDETKLLRFAGKRRRVTRYGKAKKVKKVSVAPVRRVRLSC